jgi:hypothetical protein
MSSSDSGADDPNKPLDPSGDIQVDTIPEFAPYIQMSFNLDRLEDFVVGLGVEFLHYKMQPSPIGQKDRGDYRRSDGVDTITSNGNIYTLAGRFTATMTDNTKTRNRAGGSILDPSESKLVMPRFYNNLGLADGKRIYLSPGDRIYVADPTVDVNVSNPQKMEYVPNEDNIPMFAIEEMETPLVDSRGYEYQEEVDYTITADGNIRWEAGGRNPGIDPDTGKGRIYSVRYLYSAYWYITILLKEVRVTNVTVNGERTPARMPYHAIAQREYIYHNQNRGNKLNQNKPADPKRVDAAPVPAQSPDKYGVKVEMDAYGDGYGPDDE